MFVAPINDHFATRLTHTLEVAQIARSIARALNLNEDLCEAIALGHDLGHTPFGHVGESALNSLCAGGFSHSRQSLRIVDRLENDGRGLNLTWETRQGILNHSKPRGAFLSDAPKDELSLEGQICRVADAVAYLNHDLADALTAKVIGADALPAQVTKILGNSHSERIGAMVSDIIAASWAASGAANGASRSNAGEPAIRMGEEVSAAFYALREFMFEAVYLSEDDKPPSVAARAIVELLHNHFDAHRDRIPTGYARRGGRESRAAADYVSGMTDRYAMRIAETIQPGIASPLVNGASAS